MREALRILNELKQRGLIKDYAVGGAIATLMWTEPFLTQDLDVFVVLEPPQAGLILLNPIYEYFHSRGWAWKGRWIVVEGIPVDIFPADPLEAEAVEHAAEIEYEGNDARVSHRPFRAGWERKGPSENPNVAGAIRCG